MSAVTDWSWALCFQPDLEIVDPPTFTYLAANLGSQAWEISGSSTGCLCSPHGSSLTLQTPLISSQSVPLEQL